MKSRKLMAVALTATMVVGSSVTVFANDPAPTDPSNGATGSGTTFEHVDKDVISVTLPTTAEVADVFNYYVDPERLINDAGTLADGSTAVTGNTDGVYFKNSGTSTGAPAVNASVTAYNITSGGSQVNSGLTVEVPETLAIENLVYATTIVDSASADGWYDKDNDTTYTTAVTGITIKDGSDAVVTPSSGDTITVSPYQAGATGSGTSYSSSSDAVKFVGKNSVDVDVAVKAEVTATDATKDIALVADADALTAAKTPALLMKLKVGSEEKAITSTGDTTASAKIAGVPGNFAVTTENGKYVYKIHPDENNGGTALSPWGETTVQLIGKTNSASVPTGANAMTAPKIKLTWDVNKHAEAYAGSTEVSSTAKVLTLTMPSGVTVSKVVLTLNGTDTTLAAGNHYVASTTSLNMAKYSAGWAGGTITVTYSDNHTDTLTCK